MSGKKTDPGEDIFSSLPPREPFAAFPALDAFPEQAIAFLTGKAAPAAAPDVPDAPGATNPPGPVDAAQAAVPPPEPSVAPDAAPAVAAGQPLARPAAKPGRKTQGKAEAPQESQSASRSVRASDSQSESAAESRTVDRTVSQTTNPSVRQTGRQTDRRTGSRTAAQPGSLSATQEAGQSDRQPLRQPAAPSADQPDNQPRSRTLSQPDRQFVSPSDSPTSPRAAFAADPTRAAPYAGSPRPGDRLNANQRDVLAFLLRARPYIIKFRDIAAAVGLPEATARTILRRLQSLGLVAFKKARDGNIQGVRLECDLALAAQYGFPAADSLTESQPEDRTSSLSLGRTEDVSSNVSGRYGDLQPASAQAGQEAGQPAGLQATADGPASEALAAFGWDDAFVALMWPAVHAAGFGVERIRQAAAARARLDKALDKASVCLSLDRAEWELETRGMLADLPKDVAVADAAAFVFAALARFGVLRAHPDYVSREEAYAASAASELQRRRDAAAALEQARFSAWRAGLGAQELAARMAGCPDGDEEAWLRRAWRDRSPDA